MKSILTNSTKLNTLIISLSLVFLILPTIITIEMMNRIDKVNDQGDELMNSYLNSQQASSEQPVMNSQLALSTEQLLTEEPRVFEMDTTSPNPLTMGHVESTPTDASPADADEVATVTDAEPVVELNGKKVYLTFDDGPSDYTEEILDILEEKDVKATFFVVVDSYKHQQALKDIVAEGHTIGIHSSSHVYSELYADLDAFKNDVTAVHDWVEKITGVDTHYYRFPGGSSNMVSSVPISECIKFLHEEGYEYYDWNSFSKDAENLYLSPEQLNANVMAFVRNNPEDSVVLMHDLDFHYNTVAGLADLIDTLKTEGYEILPIDDNAPTAQQYVPAE